MKIALNVLMILTSLSFISSCASYKKGCCKKEKKSCDLKKEAKKEDKKETSN
jgi:hypothetical protein